VLSFLRRPRTGPPILVICNFTPIPRTNYVVGVPEGGFWRELINSDAMDYGGSGVGNLGGVEAAPVAAHGRFHSLALTVPPLATVYFKPEPRQG
jgi:1,4-alpha-glucan branching enzyme